MHALLTGSFRAAACVVGSLGGSGEQAPDAQHRIISHRVDAVGERPGISI